MEPRRGLLRSSLCNVVLAALFLLAGGCSLKDCIFPPASRTPAPCDFEDCPAGRIRYCWNRCVPSRNAGDLCSKDPFDCGDAELAVCSAGLTCEPLPKLGWPLKGWRRDWHCVKRKQFGASCDPDIDPICPAGQFCRSTQDLPSPQPSPGVCTNWLRTGEVCKLESGTQFPCEPGLSCVEEAEFVQGAKVVRGVCRKPCQTSADCPCDNGEADCCEGHCVGPAFASTWEAIQEVIFHQSECLNCHYGPSGDGGLDLSDPVAYSNLVGRSSTNGKFIRVKPSDPEGSLLYRSIRARTHPCGGPLACEEASPMPKGKPGVNARAVDVLERWIRAGAPQFGLVADASLARCKLSPAPLKATPLVPPAGGVGVQFRPPPRDLPLGETEVCFATYYDFTSQVPVSSPCTNLPGEDCLRYHKTQFRQDQFSHHAIIRLYLGMPGVPGSRLNTSVFGTWRCRDQSGKDGIPCKPTVAGPAPAGSDCGPGQGCSSPVKQSLNGCMDFGPKDSQSLPIAGAAQACVSLEVPPDVFGAMPLRGILLWESHAINLTTPTSLAMYFNVEFADATDTVEATGELLPNTDLTVGAFEEKTICATKTFPQPVRVFQLSSHMHKKGKLFRVWGPPNDPCPSASTCPEEQNRVPVYESSSYASPCLAAVNVHLPANPDPRWQTLKFCAAFDNGRTNPKDVRQTPCPLMPGEELKCLGGSKEGTPCSSDSICQPGGTCTACPVHWGPTAEDEMMVLIPLYYPE